jgi:hypothetical protein
MSSFRIWNRGASRKFYPADVRDDCLYEVENDEQLGWRVSEHEILKTTARYVWIHRPYDHDRSKIRLDRGELERDGRSYHHDSRRCFRSAKWAQEFIKNGNQQARDYAVKAAAERMQTDRRRMELGDALEFVEVSPRVFKMRGFPLYVSADERALLAVRAERHPEDNFAYRECLPSLDRWRDRAASGQMQRSEFHIADTARLFEQDHVR